MSKPTTVVGLQDKVAQKIAELVDVVEQHPEHRGVLSTSEKIAVAIVLRRRESSYRTQSDRKRVDVRPGQQEPLGRAPPGFWPATGLGLVWDGEADLA